MLQYFFMLCEFRFREIRESCNNDPAVPASLLPPEEEIVLQMVAFPAPMAHTPTAEHQRRPHVPLELEIIRACEFIRAGAQGYPNMEASPRQSPGTGRGLPPAWNRSSIARCPRASPGATRLFTPDELAALVNTFHEIGFTYEQRLAVLYSEDPYHGVRMFAFIGALRGWRVRAFSEFRPR